MATKPSKKTEPIKKTETKKTTPIKTAAPSAKITKPKVEAPMIVKPKVTPAPIAPRPITTSSTITPTYDQIANRAYELYAASGYQHGHNEEHWLQAEFELRNKR